jgi:hypothetical protein
MVAAAAEVPLVAEEVALEVPVAAAEAAPVAADAARLQTSLNGRRRMYSAASSRLRCARCAPFLAGSHRLQRQATHQSKVCQGSFHRRSDEARDRFTRHDLY